MNYQHADPISAAARERQQDLNTNTRFLDQDKDLIRSGKVLKCTLEGSLQANTPGARERCFQSILTHGEGEGERKRARE